MGVRLPVVLIIGYGDIPMSVRAMKRGAVDFLPWRTAFRYDKIGLNLIRRFGYGSSNDALTKGFLNCTDRGCFIRIKSMALA